ncbi:tRNA uridine-5-carboxymethylaminomethyl(34) synthesis GTPase MnmE [Candidatus Karelsulcia muelleri]
MFLNNNDTITALATPNGVGAIAIIRISGPLCFQIVSMFFISKTNKPITELKPKTMYLGDLKQNNHLIDQVLLCLFKQPVSYTGEDMIEIYCHGTLYIQNKILKLFIDNGARLANQGEFTFRSFKNGKMDLIQAESLSELFKAEDELAHYLAIKNLNGQLTLFLNEIRQQIISLNSLINVSLDFEEENISEFNEKQFRDTLVLLIEKIQTTLIGFQTNKILNKVYYLVLVGRQNVGKSTLFNLLLKQDRSIVSNLSGTTINYIEEDCLIKGIKYRLVDTAGIPLTNNNLDLKVRHKTYETIKSADLILIIKDQIRDKLDQDLKLSSKKQIIIIFNKCDLLNNKRRSNTKDIFISAKYRIGLERIKQTIHEQWHKLFTPQLLTYPKENIINNMRTYECLNKVCLTLIQMKQTLMNPTLPHSLMPEILSVVLKEANDNLCQITPRVTNEEILKQIFSQFCIGK